MSDENKPYRPKDTEDLCNALENGEVCEIPTRYTMAAFRALAGRPGRRRVEMEEDANEKGWTVLRPY